MKLIPRRKTFVVKNVSAPSVFVPDIWNKGMNTSFAVTSTSATYSIERTNDNIIQTKQSAANWGTLVSGGASTSASYHSTTTPASGFRMNLLTGDQVTFNVVQAGASSENILWGAPVFFDSGDSASASISGFNYPETTSTTLFSMWIRQVPSLGTIKVFSRGLHVDSDGQDGHLYIQGDDQFVIKFRIKTDYTFLDGAWHHVLFSREAGSTIQLYIDDKEAGYSFDTADSGDELEMDRGFGGAVVGSGTISSRGEVAEVRFWHTVAPDISDQSVRRNFITSSGTPEHPQSSIDAFGIPPVDLRTDGPASTFLENFGTGPSYILNDNDEVVEGQVSDIAANTPIFQPNHINSLAVWYDIEEAQDTFSNPDDISTNDRDPSEEGSVIAFNIADPKFWLFGSSDAYYLDTDTTFSFENGITMFAVYDAGGGTTTGDVIFSASSESSQDHEDFFRIEITDASTGVETARVQALTLESDSGEIIFDYHEDEVNWFILTIGNDEMTLRHSDESDGTGDSFVTETDTITDTSMGTPDKIVIGAGFNNTNFENFAEDLSVYTWGMYDRVLEDVEITALKDYLLQRRAKKTRDITDSEDFQIITNGLLAEWRFDEGSGQVLTDYTGNGHDGQLGTTAVTDSEDPTWIDEGLSFDGGDVVEFDDVGISGTQPRTLIVVVKTSVNWGVEWVGGNLFERYTLRDAVAGSPGNVRAEISGAGYNTSLTMSTDTWHYVAITQSGSNFNTAIVYLDGDSEAVTTSATIDTQGIFQWGTRNEGPVAQEAAYGLVYDRALTSDEIAENRKALQSILGSRGISLP